MVFNGDYFILNFIDYGWVSCVNGFHDESLLLILPYLSLDLKFIRLLRCFLSSFCLSIEHLPPITFELICWGGNTNEFILDDTLCIL